MVSDVVPNPQIIALLSAASVSDSGVSGSNEGALQRIAGQSLLGCQMQAMQHAGITNFLIEVDNVPGELLSLADNFRQRGTRVEFVRSVKDLRSFLTPGSRLVVLAEAHYFSVSAIDELIEKTAPFVATVDGRDENVAFERIDLNTRWAGFAMLDAPMALSMVELPAGWSITSSLLRHAIQNRARLQPVAQADLQRGDIVRVGSQADADQIVAQMLAERADRPSGFIEQQVFGQIAKSVAPTIWAAKHGGSVLAVSRMIFAVGSIGFAALGWSAAAAIAALLAIFLYSVHAVVQGFDDNTSEISWQNRLFWVAIIASLFGAGWTNSEYGSDTLTFVAISIGLVFLAQKMDLPTWSAAIMRSPALLAAATLLAAVLSAFTLGTKIVVLAQLALLIAALYLPVSTGKNDNHA